MRRPQVYYEEEETTKQKRLREREEWAERKTAMIFDGAIEEARAWALAQQKKFGRIRKRSLDGELLAPTKKFALKQTVRILATGRVGRTARGCRGGGACCRASELARHPAA